MIQSKNKFLPPLYIRKCKITYLECFAILQRAGCYGQLLLVFESMTLHLHTAHRCVRVHRWVGMEGRVDGWVGRGMNEHQAGALWGTQKRNTDHRKVDARNVAKHIGTDQRAKWRRKEPRDASECTAPCERLRDFCRSEKKTKTKTDGTKQLPTAPAARGNAIVRGLVSTY